MAGGAVKYIFQLMFLPKAVTRNMQVILAKILRPDLEFISALLQSGDIKSPIDKNFLLNELPQAMSYLENGHVRGKIVVTVP
jgi:NADPH:quinone reductase-like Zn-dependent oxidoreductase